MFQFERVYRIYLVLLICVLMFAIVGVIKPGFASLLNIGNVLAITAIVAMAGAGQTLCVLAGGDGIDLSVGQVMSLSAVLAYMIMNGADERLLITLLVIIGCGLIIGLINGLGIEFIGMPPLVMTLGMASIVSGTVFALAAGGSPHGQVAPLLLAIASGRLAGIRYLALVGLLMVLFVECLLRYTIYGKWLYLVGNNGRVAWLCGIPVRRVKVMTYTLSGILSSLAGLFLLGYAGTANLNLGGDYLLLTVASVVIGGTQLSGGEGTYVGTYAGSLMLILLTNVLYTFQVPQAMRDLVLGVVLLLSLVLYGRQMRLQE